VAVAASPAAASVAAPAASAVASPAPSAPAAAAAIDASLASVWQGKTITVIAGDAAGGGHDVWGRLVARHFSKYLSGNPTLIVQNMPGAVQRIAANAIYTAKPDGMTIGIIANTIPTNQLRGEGAEEGVRYDANRMLWIGSPNAATRVLVVHSRAGVTAAKQLDTHPIRLGTDSPGTVSHISAAVLNHGLGWKNQTIFGYQGSASVVLGIERGEIDGLVNSWDSWLATKGDDIRSKTLVPLVQIGPRDPDPLLAGVPTAEELFAGKPVQAHQLLNLAQRPFEWSFPFVAPPDMPANMISTLRAAFTAAVSDPDLMSEATRSGLRINPRTGERVQALIADYLNTPKSIVEELDNLVTTDSQ
jgi:tripartite-type tricarboxylate transporter receptor subunit TctC